MTRATLLEVARTENLRKEERPFSLEEATSSNYIDFQERSLANAMAPGKERGIMLHGRPAKGLRKR